MSTTHLKGCERHETTKVGHAETSVSLQVRDDGFAMSNLLLQCEAWCNAKERSREVMYKSIITQSFQADKRVHLEMTVASAPRRNATSIPLFLLDFHSKRLKNYIATTSRGWKLSKHDYHVQGLCIMHLEGGTHTTVARRVSNVYKLHQADNAWMNVSMQACINARLCQPTRFRARRSFYPKDP